jgi:hypothetical protein
MFELMSKVKVDADKETQQYMNLTGQFESFTTSYKSKNDMKSAAEKYKTAGLEE